MTHDYIIYPICIILIAVFIYFKFGKKRFLLYCVAVLVGLGISFIHIHTGVSSYSGIVIEAKDNYFIFYANGERFYVSNYNSSIEIGDILKIKSTPVDLSFKVTESAFDFKQYLNDKNIFYELDNPNIEVIYSSPIRSRSLKHHFLLYFDKDVRSLVSSLLFGMSYEDGFTLFNELHLYRLFNLGGVFINFFIYSLTFILTIFVRKDKSRLISLFILSPYFLLNIGKFTIFRIVFINIISLVNEYAYHKKFNRLSVVSFCAIINLIFDFSLAYQDSFILGYLFSIVNIIVFNSLSRFKKNTKSLISGIFVFFFFIPFELTYYKEISFLSPLVFVILWPILAFINLINLICFYKIPIYGLSNFLLNSLIKCDSILSFDGLKLYGDEFSLSIALLYEVGLFFALYLFQVRFKPLYKYSAGLLISILIIHFTPIENNFTSEIDFINVGQGDATLIRYKNDTILVDTGGNLYRDLATETLIPYFKRNKIYDIDYLIITHNDFDHCGAKESLMENFNVKTLVDREEMFPLKVNDLTLYNLNPYSFVYDRGENAASIVLSFNFLNKDILLMGDATSEIESYIVDHNPSLKCDILKVGHHGSKTSSSEKFISFLRPEAAIISCGKDNNYGHPNKEVIDVLNKYNVKMYRTDLSGTITFTGKHLQ